MGRFDVAHEVFCSQVLFPPRNCGGKVSALLGGAGGEIGGEQGLVEFFQLVETLAALWPVEDSKDQGAEDLRSRGLTAQDAVIGIAASAIGTYSPRT